MKAALTQMVNIAKDQGITVIDEAEIDLINKSYSQLISAAPIPETSKEPFTDEEVQSKGIQILGKLIHNKIHY